MRFCRRELCRSLLLLLVCLGSRPLESADRDLADRVRALLPKHVGAAVMAIDGGRTVFKQAWGPRRHDRPAPCTPTTNFRLASVSKHFTATAALLLEDRDQLALDDTLDRFFPEAPQYWRRITVHHLLVHTSGLPDYESLIPPGTTLQLTDYNVLAMLRETDEPLSEPGTKFAYSNSGYTLLGLIVEVVAGRPFHRFVREELLAPTGMRHSVLFVAGVNAIPERAFGHELHAERDWVLADQSVTSAIRGDGGIYSSLDDLERWLAAQDGICLLSDESYQAMLTPHVRTDRGQQSYGYGWFLDDYRGQRRVMHGGSTRGFSTMLQRFPDRRGAVVILLNRSRPDPVGDYAERIVDLLLFEQKQK